MVRDITEVPITGSDFIITIHCKTLGVHVKVWASVEDTVLTIKEFMGERLELFSDEMTILASQSHPYPLPDEMRLSRLLVEHRHITLLTHEGNEVVYGVETSETDSACSWWGQPVPKRYIGQVDSRVIFDFRYLSYEYVSSIRSWMYQVRNVSEIWLLGTHPKVMDILYAIAEDVLCLTDLHAIIIQNPASPMYSIPYKSLFRRTMGEEKCVLQREGLLYLYQHLLLDQYRASAEEIHIVVDGGLLPGRNERWRFLP